MRGLGPVVLTLLLAGSLAYGQSQQVAKHRIAILDFSYETVLTASQSLFGGNQNIGRNLADMLADRLTNDGIYRVIDRNAINKVLSEQVPPREDRFDNSPVFSTSKVGRVLGVDPVLRYFNVDAVVTAEITQFGRNDQAKGPGGLAHLCKFCSSGSGQKAKAIVGITLRMIDVSTGEILASVTVKTESLHSGANMLGINGGNAIVANMTSANFPQTILGEATMQAIHLMAQALEQKALNLPPVDSTPVSGLVADVSGNDITLNIGNMDGVHVGDTLLITRITRVIKDPTTGKPIRSVEDTVGQITISSVDFSSSVGRFSGTGKPAVGDSVKNMPRSN